MEAIAEIKTDSAAGPDAIPAVLLKNCASSVALPLRLLWQRSFDLGLVPQIYKESLVCPLYKKGDRAKAINYRPVSLTSHIIKVFERVLRKIMARFIEKNGLISENQHGFRSGRSCLTQILAHYDDIYNGFINNEDTDSIYLDYAKAFDKVDHRLLILKLKRYSFHPNLVKWIESFLSNRFQRVIVGNAQSYKAPILSGVPQGTVLGPILFIIFINDLESRIEHSVVRFFADDTRVSKRITEEKDTVELQQDLEVVMKWSSESNMVQHEQEFEVLN